MIDTLTETVLTLAQAAEELPRRRLGRKTHVSTLSRWATGGHRGIVLETIRIGGSRCTSREALQRFFEQLSGPSIPPRPARDSVTDRPEAADCDLGEQDLVPRESDRDTARAGTPTRPNAPSC